MDSASLQWVLGICSLLLFFPVSSSQQSTLTTGLNGGEIHALRNSVSVRKTWMEWRNQSARKIVPVQPAPQSNHPRSYLKPVPKHPSPPPTYSSPSFAPPPYL
ncbi:hypothetical protein SUGI_1194450 [Cryptomeria japonica]|nr:hypothetical protein SUGI_1194450 [Cryptomeria japonica]